MLIARTVTLHGYLEYPILGYSKSGYILGTINKTFPHDMARKLTKEKLIATLVRIRKEAGLTQQQLAEKLDKPQSYVSKYENGERTLDFIEVIDIFETIGADPIELITKLRS